MTEEIIIESKVTPNTDTTNTAHNTRENVPTSEKLSLTGITQIVYGCQLLSFFFGISSIVGVIINYLKIAEVKGTWLESHFVWQIRTFWIGLIISVIGFMTTIILIGFLILAANLVWVIYRVVKGWLQLVEGKPIEDSKAFI